MLTQRAKLWDTLKHLLEGQRHQSRSIRKGKKRQRIIETQQNAQKQGKQNKVIIYH